VYKESAGHLLELAKADQLVFRTLVAGMNPEQKSLLEEILHSVGVGAAAARMDTDSAESAPQAAPSIALRMDF
jgi:hypothetical protein